MARKDNRPENPVSRVSLIGQSIWLDDLSRGLIDSGGLKKYIDVGLRGVTSTPKIFAAAISDGSAYDQPIQELARRGRSALEIYEAQDVDEAAKTLGRLGDFGIDMMDVTEQLLREGVRKFDEPFTELLDGLQAKIAA